MLFQLTFKNSLSMTGAYPPKKSVPCKAAISISSLKRMKMIFPCSDCCQICTQTVAAPKSFLPKQEQNAWKTKDPHAELKISLRLDSADLYTEMSLCDSQIGLKVGYPCSLA
jgi:hypothetical protein